MKFLLRVSVAVLGTVLILNACKKTEQNLPASSPVQEGQQAATPAPAAPVINNHVAIEPFNGTGTPYYKYTGVAATYAPVNGSVTLDNLIRSTAAGNPALLNVTGLAVIPGGAAFCLSRPSSTVNWQIWKFPVGDPNSAGLVATIAGTASRSLSDLEWDATANRFLLLERISGRLCALPSPFTAITLTGSYLGVPNVSGLAIAGPSPYLLGQSGTTGYLMLCNNATLLPVWTLACATYTPPAVPFAFVESGCFFDALSSGTFIVGSVWGGLSGNWTPTRPNCSTGGPIPPAWLAANIKMIDFAAY
jgi:hypothetical protein